jgi:hypothetical protein
MLRRAKDGFSKKKNQPYGAMISLISNAIPK